MRDPIVEREIAYDRDTSGRKSGDAPAASELKELSLAELRAVDTERKLEPVDVPEWGARVYVRELSALERDQLDTSFYGEGDDKPELGDYRAKVVAACLCRADGTLYLKPGDPAGVKVIAAKSPVPVRRIAEVALRLNRLRKEDADAGKGDSGGTPAAGSPSASPSPSGSGT